MRASRPNLERAVQAARDAKHRWHLWSTRTRLRLRAEARDRSRSFQAAMRPYRFDHDRYLDARGFPPFDYFLDADPEPGEVIADLPAPPILWCFWTWPNPMPSRRRASLDAIRESVQGLEVRLVTAENLHDHVVPEFPLHPAYEQLSAVHRADYLRAYFLHRIGGGYSDIKPPGHGFPAAFTRLNRSPSTWLIGYQEVDSDLVANLHGPLGDDVRRNYQRISGFAGIVARPRTPFTGEWLAEVERRLDYSTRRLAHHPAADPLGTNPGYPITWIGIGANVFQPLQLKYLDHIEVDPELQPQLFDYR